MLSWAVDDLLVDGRSMGDLLQGVTTVIFGEGSSMGPLTEEMKERQLAAQGDVRFPTGEKSGRALHGPGKVVR